MGLRASTGPRLTFRMRVPCRADCASFHPLSQDRNAYESPIVMAVTDQLAPELRTLVKVSVAWLGRVISRAAGEEQFTRIEKLRIRMAGLREAMGQAGVEELESVLAELRALSPGQRRERAGARSSEFGFLCGGQITSDCKTEFRRPGTR